MHIGSTHTLTKHPSFCRVLGLIFVSACVCICMHMYAFFAYTALLFYLHARIQSKLTIHTHTHTHTHVTQILRIRFLVSQDSKLAWGAFEQRTDGIFLSQRCPGAVQNVYRKIKSYIDGLGHPQQR
jgi:hypothetical protein